MSKFKKIIYNWKILLLIFCLLLAVIAISPKFPESGAAIIFVEENSLAANNGFESPDPKATPTSLEIIKEINGIKVQNNSHYYTIINSLEINDTVSFVTNKDNFRFKMQEQYDEIIINDTEQGTIEEITEDIIDENIDDIDETIAEDLDNVTEEDNNVEDLGIDTNITDDITDLITTKQVPTGVIQDIGIRVVEPATNNIRKGVDLAGGVRVLLTIDEENVDPETFASVKQILSNRLNNLGLANVEVREVTDLTGITYFAAEISGAKEEQVKTILSTQGEFEAKIAGKTVFIGGEKNIVYVCKTSECSGVTECSTDQSQSYCNYQFQITLTDDAAQRFGDVTRDLQVVGEHLNESIFFYLDGKEKQSLKIDSSLRGQAQTRILITGSSVDETESDAFLEAKKEMAYLQSILLTGSIPVKLKIERTDSFSPILGEELLRNTIIVGLFAILAVVLVVLIRFRKISIAIPMIITMLSELILILGFASLIKWELDLAAMAGILIAIGTGVDHQIVIADEILRGEKSGLSLSWKKRIGNAFGIIMIAYFTTVAAMVPLMFAGAGLLKGFAFTTIIGVTMGVFITRPAFAAMLENLLK
ncbi:hypothetical protein ACFL1H_07455 [Nanoarchaeota archaeon]